jgi:flagellar hook assembly protein FlgD
MIKIVPTSEQPPLPPSNGTSNVAENQLPQEFKLDQNYPNPLNPTTVIEYHVPEAVHVQLEIYNILGKRIAILVNGQQETGSYTVTWNGKNEFDETVSSGIYIYRLTAGQFTSLKTMLLLR